MDKRKAPSKELQEMSLQNCFLQNCKMYQMLISSYEMKINYSKIIQSDLFYFFILSLTVEACPFLNCENLPNARFPLRNLLGLVFSAELGATFLSASCDA